MSVEASPPEFNPFDPNSRTGLTRGLFLRRHAATRYNPRI